MDDEEKQYSEGFEIAQKYCSRIKPSFQETYKIPCPVQWSEPKENGFYDAIAEYRRGLNEPA